MKFLIIKTSMGHFGYGVKAKELESGREVSALFLRAPSEEEIFSELRRKMELKKRVDAFMAMTGKTVEEKLENTPVKPNKIEIQKALDEIAKQRSKANP